MSMTTSFLNPLSLPAPRVCNPGSSTRRRAGFDWQRARPPRRGDKATSCALHRGRGASFGHGYDGKLVDEDMIVLRMRIHEMKTLEESLADVEASNWMAWEKKYYIEDYDSDICEAVGLLQSQLMNTRPGLALAMLGLVSISVPISMGVVLLHLVNMAKLVIFGFQ